MTQLLLVLLLALIAFDFALHVWWLLTGKPLFYFPSWRVYNIFWTAFWGVALVLVLSAIYTAGA